MALSGTHSKNSVPITRSKSAIWQNMGFELALAKVLVGLSGGCEMLFGLCFLKWNRSILLHRLNIIGLAGLLLLLIAFTAPLQLTAAFNPVVMRYRHADAFCSGHSTHPTGTSRKCLNNDPLAFPYAVKRINQLEECLMISCNSCSGASRSSSVS